MIEIYTRPGCGFCHRAKRLLDGKELTYQEYNIWEEEGRNEEMLKRSNGERTVPQVFINDNHIGGCDDLFDFDANNGFKALLQE